jgi:hypothetical protein
VIQSNPRNSETFSDLYRLLPYMRQALGCCVCANILFDPMGPVDSKCQHHVCRACIGGKMRLKPRCSWCKDHSTFRENVQLRLVVHCFKKLCEYIATTPISTSLAKTNNGGTNALLGIIQEGMAIQDTYRLESCQLSPRVGSMPSPRAAASQLAAADAGKNNRNRTAAPVTKDAKKADRTPHGHVDKIQAVDKDVSFSERCCKVELCSTECGRTDISPTRRGSHGTTATTVQTHRTVVVDHDYNKERATVTDTHDAPKLKPVTVKPVTVSQNELKTSKNTTSAGNYRKRQRSSSAAEEEVSSGKETKEQSVPKVKPPRKKKPKPSGCRCGMATPNPGTLTCRGQRCPCYSNFQGCVNCRCRGCLNPRGEVPPPVLEKGHDSGSNDTESDVDID